MVETVNTSAAPPAISRSTFKKKFTRQHRPKDFSIFQRDIASPYRDQDL